MTKRRKTNTETLKISATGHKMNTKIQNNCKRSPRDTNNYKNTKEMSKNMQNNVKETQTITETLKIAK